MIDYDQIKFLSNRLELEINRHHDKLLSMFPIERYVNLLDDYPNYAGPAFCSDEVEIYCKDIIRTTDTKIMGLYHKLLIVNLIAGAENKVKSKNLPDEVKQYYFKDFNRIVRQIDIDLESYEYYLHSNDSFGKDLAICSLRMFPIGGRKYHYCRFPVRNFLTKRREELIKVILFLIFETRGIEPFLRSHYDTHDPNFMDEFTLKGIIYSHRLVAKVMKMNPQIKGELGASWIGDPQIERISPRLAYIRYFHIANGARYFKIGPRDSAAINATMKSRTRKKLFKEGKYLPSDFLDVWSRKSMIKWADKLNWYW